MSPFKEQVASGIFISVHPLLHVKAPQYVDGVRRSREEHSICSRLGCLPSLSSWAAHVLKEAVRPSAFTPGQTSFPGRGQPRWKLPDLDFIPAAFLSSPPFLGLTLGRGSCLLPFRSTNCALLPTGSLFSSRGFSWVPCPVLRALPPPGSHLRWAICVSPWAQWSMKGSSARVCSHACY